MRSAGRVEPQSGTASLGTLRVQLHDVIATAKFDGSVKYYAGFSDAAGTWNQAKITDLSFVYWAGSLSKPQDSSAADLTRSLRSIFRVPNLEVWLRIGLARPFAPRNGQKPMCYLQITGIYTFPDYLNGAAWYDFERPRV